MTTLTRAGCAIAVVGGCLTLGSAIMIGQAPGSAAGAKGAVVGTGAFTFVENISAVKSAGLTVVSQGGVAVPIPPNFRGALVADPNNFFVTLFEACDACAPRETAAAR